MLLIDENNENIEKMVDIALQGFFDSIIEYFENNTVTTQLTTQI